MDRNVFKSGYIHNEAQAHEFLEAIRWPSGPVCAHCKGTAKIYRLKPTKTGRRVLKCGTCRKQFTVTLGTIFEGSHIPLTKWIGAFHLLCASKKGMSAHQLHRMLGVTYKTAWFMAHRIRHTMKQNPFTEKLDGIVEADETYIGGMGHGKQGSKAHKKPVFTLLQRGGQVRSFHVVSRVTGKNLKEIIRENVSPDAHIMTDQHHGYHGLAR
ncbi:MAG TPA: IS1595 family transposase, partial [Nitrospiraceae bacterium]|nr:IS1595 family transposase [Nitrospiraceae bacterium]